MSKSYKKIYAEIRVPETINTVTVIKPSLQMQPDKPVTCAALPACAPLTDLPKLRLL